MRVCATPNAVATGGEDLKIESGREIESSRSGNEGSSADASPSASVINDTASVDGPNCVLEDGAVQCTVHVGGGDGGDEGGEGSGGGDGDDSGDSNNSDNENENGNLLAFAGWAASAADKASQVEIAAGLAGSAKTAGATLFVLNLMTTALTRSFGGKRRANDGETTGSAKPVALATETPIEASSSSSLASSTIAEGVATTSKEHREASAALAWERGEARRRASAELASASVDESVDAVVSVVGAALARSAPEKKGMGKQSDKKSLKSEFKSETVPVGITALASVNPATEKESVIETREGTTEEKDVSATQSSTSDTKSSPDPIGLSSVHFAVIPNDASDPRVIAALREAAEAQVAASDAMRAAAAATRAAAEATAFVQKMQTCIASGNEGEGCVVGEELSNSGSVSRASRDAKAHAADAEKAASVASKARTQTTGYSSGYESQPRPVAAPSLETPESSTSAASVVEGTSVAGRAAGAVGRGIASMTNHIGAGIITGAKHVVPKVGDAIGSAVQTHGPTVRREATSFFGAVGLGVKNAWHGVDKEAVARNGRTEIVHSPGLRERLGGLFTKMRKTSGLYDEDRAKKEEEEKKKGGVA